MTTSSAWKACLLAAGLSLALSGCGRSSEPEGEAAVDASADVGPAMPPGAEAQAGGLAMDPAAAATPPPSPSPSAVAPAPRITAPGADASPTASMLAMATEAPAVNAPRPGPPGGGGGAVPGGYGAGEPGGYGGYGGEGAAAPGAPGGYGSEYGDPTGQAGGQRGGRMGLVAEGPAGGAPDPAGAGPANPAGGYGGYGASPEAIPGGEGAALPGAPAGGYGAPAAGAGGPGGYNAAMAAGYGQPGAPSLGGEIPGGGYGGEIPGGGYGGPGGGFGGPGNASTPVYRDPISAVQTFLAAVKTKDLDKIADAVAKRAATEEVKDAAKRKYFSAILSRSLAQDQVEDLARELDGMDVVSMNTMRETGRVGVIVGKQSEREYVQRTIHVRREKEGWKVIEIEGKKVYQPMGGQRKGAGGRR